MTDTNPESEPSMEEILASIRRIISDGDAGDEATEAAGPAEAAASGAEAAETVPEPGPEDDILDLTQMVTEQGEVVDLNEAKTARGMAPPAAETPAEDLTSESLVDALAEVAQRDATGEEAAAEAVPSVEPEPVVEHTAEAAAFSEAEVEIPEAPSVEATPLESVPPEAPQVEQPQVEQPPIEEPVQEAEDVAVAAKAAEAADGTESSAQALLEPAPVMPMVSDIEDEMPDTEPEASQPPFSVDELAEIEAATAAQAETHAEAQAFSQETMPAAGQPDAEAQADALSGEAVETPREAMSEAPLQEPTVMAAQSAEEWSEVPEEPDSSDDTSLIDFAPEEDEVEEQPELVVEPVTEESTEGLISETAAAGAIAALSGLAEAARSSGQSQDAGATPLGMNRTLEELVKEAITPHLKTWLDVNLEPLVERIVREEIQRLRRRSENF